jgi:predicted metal-dependent hydrolase
MLSATRTSLFRGRDLFDAGAFFEAHEVWEEAWLAEEGTTRLLLQGLIQVAAAFHKVSRGDHPGGAVRLFDAGVRKLADVPAGAAGGLRLAAFRDAVARWRETAAAWEAGSGGPPALEDRPRLGAAEGETPPTPAG